MKQIVRHKIIDKSILWDGMTLPRDVNQVLYEMLGSIIPHVIKGEDFPEDIQLEMAEAMSENALYNET